jgi:hypothetical protein
MFSGVYLFFFTKGAKPMRKLVLAVAVCVSFAYVGSVEAGGGLFGLRRTSSACSSGSCGTSSGVYGGALPQQFQPVYFIPRPVVYVQSQPVLEVRTTFVYPRSRPVACQCGGKCPCGAACQWGDVNTRPVQVQQSFQPMYGGCSSGQCGR